MAALIDFFPHFRLYTDMMTRTIWKVFFFYHRSIIVVRGRTNTKKNEFYVKFLHIFM